MDNTKNYFFTKLVLILTMLMVYPALANVDQLELAVFLIKNNNLEKGHKSLTLAKSQKELNQAKWHGAHGLYLLKLKKYQEAYNALKMAIKLDKNFKAAYLWQAQVLTQLEKHAELILLLEEKEFFSTKDPTIAQMSKQLGFDLLKRCWYHSFF